MTVHANPTRLDQWGKKRLDQLDSIRHLYVREHAAQRNDSKALNHHSEAKILLQQSFRRAIINEFCKTNPDIASAALEVGFGCFGWDVRCIYVITVGSIKVPKHFSDVTINKGTIIKKVSENTVYVKWRDVGGSDRNFKFKERETFQQAHPKGPRRRRSR